METPTENKRFGSFLRGLREQRRLSLDAVEEMSLGLPERVTKSHLSRIENGRAIPTFPRMFTLSQIYGIPVAYLAERFEISLMRGMFPPEATVKPTEEVMAEARRLELGGRHKDSLIMYEALLDRVRSEGGPPEFIVELELYCVNDLIKLSRWAAAKEECERVLNSPGLSQRQTVIALHYLGVCCYKLGKHTMAMMAIQNADKQLEKVEDGESLRGSLTLLKGTVHFVLKDFQAAAEAFREAVARFEKAGSGFEACRARLNLAAALIEIGSRARARELLEQALAQAESAGYDRQRAYALGHLAMLAFKEKDLEAAEAYCLRSNSIGRPREYESVVWRNCYYLWRIAQARGDDAGVKTNERTLKTYLSRAEEYMSEVEDFKAYLDRGKRDE